MENLRIPETATESYLEHLEANIMRQISQTNNSKVKAHLHGLLREVQRRLKQFRQNAQPESEQEGSSLEVLLLTDDLAEEASSPEITPAAAAAKPALAAAADDAEAFVLTDIIEEMEEIPAEDDPLSTVERRVFKDRLHGLLEKFQEKQKVSPEQPPNQILTDLMQEMNRETPLDHADMTEEQHEKIKNRLKGILGAFQAQTEEQEPPAPSFLETLTKVHRSVPDEDTELPPVEDLETLRFFAGQSAAATSAAAGANPLAPDEVFLEVCQKVAQGESLALLKALDLSPREKELLKAFLSHLSSYKGLKKQQSFEMQHLTARSIHELDQIFKTYQLQGYLKAELNNVYNRLLNLRSRFSLLLT